MKFSKFQTKCFCLAICLLFLAQTAIFAQDKKPLEYNYVISKLTFTSRISKSTEQINEELIKEISQRKVDFVLTTKDEAELREAGASDLLIKTIDKSASEEIKKRLKQTYNSIIPIPKAGKEHYEQLELAIEVSKQYLRIFRDEPESELLIKYLEKSIPKAEKKLAEHKRDKISENTNQQIPIDNIRKQPRVNEKQDKYFAEALKIYNRFTDNYRGNHKQLKIALEAAKEFVEKFGNDEEFKPQVDYLKRVIPHLENKLKPYEPHPPSNYYKLDQAYKNKKWNDFFKIGAEILEDEPEFVDVTIVLASVGFNKIAKENPKSKKLTEAVFYAEKAIKLLEASTKSRFGKYGVYDYEYKTKENALGWMNYIIGYIKYYHLNEKEKAIPFFQKSLEYDSEVRKFADEMPISKNQKKPDTQITLSLKKSVCYNASDPC